MNALRLFLFFEGLVFVVANLVHGGVVVEGYRHRQANIAESLIAAVLLAGCAASLFRPAWTRRIAIAAQILVLIGTLAGLVAIAVRFEPRIGSRMVYGAVMLCGSVSDLVEAIG